MKDGIKYQIVLAPQRLMHTEWFHGDCLADYEFDFAKLERWVSMCQSCGMTYFEMSHLFTQWGATHPPKIMAEENGKEIKLFGWNDPAVGGRYTRFLEAYLPKLTEKLGELGIAGITRFHISDEPEPQHLSSYKQARELRLCGAIIVRHRIF